MLVKLLFLHFFDLNYSIYCTSHLDRNTWILFCNYKLYKHNDLLSHRDLVEHTCVVWPYRNLEIPNCKNFLKCDEMYLFTVLAKRSSFTFNNFPTPSWCTWYCRYSWLGVDVWSIKTKWIFTTSQISSRSTLVASLY